MTRDNALKAPCPYQPGKLCIANGCPKWRWLSPWECSRSNGYGTKCLSDCLEDTITNFGENEENLGQFSSDYAETLDACMWCESREGYCS